MLQNKDIQYGYTIELQVAWVDKSWITSFILNLLSCVGKILASKLRETLQV